MSKSEVTLLRRIGGGDREAYRALVERLGPPAFGLARRITNNPELAEEALQEAFVDVWRKAGRFDPQRGGVRQWVLTLVHHKAVDAVRRERSAARVSEMQNAPMPAPSDDPETYGWMADRRERIRKAMDELSPIQREALELAYFGGLTYRQVAEHLEIPEGTAKSRLRDGLITLRGIMETFGVEAGVE